MDDDEQIIVGRGPQLATIRERLEDPATRVITLRGHGGVGKTTLARSIASERGAPFVELDVCDDVDDIESVVRD